MADKLLVNLGPDRLVTVGTCPEGGLPETVSRGRLEWPLDDGALEDLRWYLEDYLRAPFGVWEDRGPKVQARLAGWGEAVFASVFGTGPARDAYQWARDRDVELVFRSASPGMLGLPWELMRDPDGPVALSLAGVSRALPVADLTGTTRVLDGRLRVLIVISRPADTADVGYRMIARPLLERLDAVRGQVDLVVLRPPTLGALRSTLAEAARDGKPFHVVHFDGHGVRPGRRADSPWPMVERVLAFETPGGGSDEVPASKVAAALRDGQVPVVVLNACQSGAVGKELEGAVATRLLGEDTAAVVAMAYSVYAVAAAEFMAAFYERLFAGDTVSAAVTAGRRRLFQKNKRPSPKGDLPLADWLVPVHYLNRDISFPQARAERPASAQSLDTSLDRPRTPSIKPGAGSLDPVGTFVGRDDLFYQLEVTTRLERVVVLYGPGGTGKTELAKAFGRWWRDTGGVDQPDWALWYSFEPGVASFGLEGVITEIGRAIFGSDVDHWSSCEQRSKVEDALAKRRILLIWDNFETVKSMPDPAGATKPLDETGCQELRGFLEQVAKGGHSAVIITSRTPEEWLGGMRCILVGSLAAEEAAQYAGQLLTPYPAAAARRARRAFGELLEWLDGHPLSMRLILPRLDTADPEALMDGLHGTVPLPGGDYPEGGRTTSLAVSIAYSIAHLAAETRRLLPAICLFHGVADADVLASFCEVPGVPERFRAVSREQWGEALDETARVGLLSGIGTEVRAGMYRIPPALPAYLNAQWRTEEPGDHAAMREAATRALLAACARLGVWADQQIAAGDTRLAFTVLGLQRRTLGSLLGYALDHGLWGEVQAITQPLNLYWNASGLHKEASAWADRATLATEGPDGTAPPLGTPAGALWLFLTGSQAARLARSGRNNDAERAYLKNLAMLQPQSESFQKQRSLAVTCHQLGRINQNRGRLDDAENWYAKSLALMEELGDRPGVAANYHQFGILAQFRGRLDDAESWYVKSLAIREELGEQPGMASIYHMLGMVAHLRGQLADAAHRYSSSLAIREEYGDRPGMALTYEQLGNVAKDLGRLDEAENFYVISLAIEEELGNRPGMAAIYEQLGSVAKDRGRLDDATNWYVKSLAIGEELDDRPGVADVYYRLGGVTQELGRLGDAENWYARSLAIRQEFGDRPGIAAIYHQLGIVAHLRGRLDDAENWYAKSLVFEEELGDRPGLAVSYHQLGRLAQDRERLEEAENWYARSLAIDEELNNRPGMAATYGQLGLVADARGQPREALAWMIRCVALFEEFPQPATGPGPEHLARLATQLGTEVLEMCWQATTGTALPEAVRAYLDSSPPSGDG